MIPHLKFKTNAVLLALSWVLVAGRAVASVDMAAAVGTSLANQQSTSTEASISTGRKSFSSYGLFANIPLASPEYRFSAGFLYTETGSHTRSSAAGATDEFDVKLPYFEIPAVIDYCPIEVFSVGVGGYVGFPAGNVSVSGVQSSTGAVNPYSSSGTFDTLRFKSDDYGMVFHAQIKIPVSSAAFLTLNSLYLFGIENIDSSGQAVIRNDAVVIQGGVGVSI